MKLHFLKTYIPTFKKGNNIYRSLLDFLSAINKGKSVGKCLSCSRKADCILSCSEMANCDSTSIQVLDLSTLTENVAGDDSTEQSESLGSRQVRSVYLITYSRANEEIVPNRESFVQLVLDSFDNADPLTRCEIVQWVCNQERHRDEGIHYHMEVKLNARRRWLKIRNYLDE